jgi:hypothetical protein
MPVLGESLRGNSKGKQKKFPAPINHAMVVREIEELSVYSVCFWY